MTRPLPRLLELLHSATDLKLLRHRSEAALALLSQADALCDEHPDLPRSLRGLVAYRMGHLRMRAASDFASLELAEQDFMRARRLGEGLEPWVGLYHLAVLGRLAALTRRPSAAARLRQRLADCWDHVVRTQVQLDPGEVPDRDDPIVQRGSLNAAEALAYALGLDLSGLEGLGALEHALHCELDWGFLAGPDLEGPRVRLPWTMLPATLRQLHEAQPGALSFLLPPGERQAQLWSDPVSPPRLVGRQHALLLAWALTGSEGGRRGLERQAHGLSPAARRKLLQRTRELLASATGRHHDAVLLWDESERLVPGEGLVLFGAVHGGSWARH